MSVLQISSPLLQMTVQGLILENDRMKEENQHLMSENILQKGQIANLAQVNVFASNIVRLTETNGNPARISLMKKTISAFVTSARSIILSASYGIANVSLTLRDLVIKICNFVWDHLGEIGVQAIIVPAIAVCVGVAGLAIAIISGNIEATEMNGQALIDYNNFIEMLPNV